MPFATRERIWAELPPLDGEPEVKIEKKEVKEGDVIKIVEVRTTTVRKLKCVEERKEWPLFGLSEEDIKANDGMSEMEEVVWENPVTEKQPQKKQAGKKEFDEVKCRFCGGNHFSHQCTQKRVEVEPREEETTKAADERPAPSTSSSSGTYSVRDRIGKSGGRMKMNNVEDYKILVSNLSERATEDDVRRLFGRFGDITRCFVKQKYGGGNMGYAIVNYASEKDALRAVEKLNRYAYDHQILSVELLDKK